MKEAFITRRFSEDSLKMIALMNGILEEYRAQGYTLTLRQLYYQLVARDLFEPSRRWRKITDSKWVKDENGTGNAPPNYKWIGGLVSDARQAGLVDWEMIEDRGRDTSIPAHWSSPAQIIRIAANQFRIDKWKRQPYHIEVMVEKDALSGVLDPVCRALDIGLSANKGYSSSSTMYEIGQRLAAQERKDKQICIIYLGDHDPSGIDMTRDVDDRLKMYSRVEGVEVVRLALNYAQVEEWQPPENPAKESDSRFADYEALYGSSSWELDAIEPRQLASLVTTAVEERRDEDLWQEAVEEEKAMRRAMSRFADSFDSDPEKFNDEDDDYSDDDEEE